MSFGITEILLILVVAILIFGTKRIPEIAKALGRAGHEFKKAKKEIEKESKEFMDSAESCTNVAGKKEEK